jgi:hypothetical protein
MKKSLLLALALMAVLLIGPPAQAQGPRGVGRPAIFKNSSGITIETEDELAQAVSRLEQLLDSGSYQVKKQVLTDVGIARIVAHRPLVGVANTTLLLQFVIAGKSKDNPTTLIFVTGFYQKAGKKYPEVGLNDPKQEPAATVWAAEYKVATTYPLAKLWYRAEDAHGLAKAQYEVIAFLTK